MFRDITVNGMTLPANTMISPIMVEILKVTIQLLLYIIKERLPRAF